MWQPLRTATDDNGTRWVALDDLLLVLTTATLICDKAGNDHAASIVAAITRDIAKAAQ